MTQPDDLAAALDELATVNDVARALGIQPGTVRQHVHAGVQWLPTPTRIGGRLYWRKADIKDLAARKPAPHRPKASTPPAAQL